jgi:uncharacterized protein
MKTLNTLLLLGIGSAALGFSSLTQAASFDCAKAATPVEKAICTDGELSGLDEEMARLYKRAMQHGDAGEIKSGQKTWLKERNGCGNDNGCIKDQYNYRISDLARAVYLPQELDTCSTLVIDKKLTRFDGATPGESGGEVIVGMEHNLGFYVMSVDDLPESENSDKYMFDTDDFAEGDKVKVCLTSIPPDCPPGDDRGKEYHITNYKNGKSFSGTPDWHSCGGA